MKNFDPLFTIRKFNHCSFTGGDRTDTEYSFDEMLKAAVETGTSLKATPQESDKTHCPFTSRHGVSIFEYYAEHTDKALRFAKAMAAYRRSKPADLRWNITAH